MNDRLNEELAAGMLRMDRRRFMAATIGTALAASTAAACNAPPWTPPSNPFTLGVASGDPEEDKVIIWTRLCIDPLALGSGMPAQDVNVAWLVATDPTFTNVVAGGGTVATQALGHSVHIDVTGLSPSTTYYYGFNTGGVASAVGTTKTAPAQGSPVGQLTFAAASCQNFEDGFFTAYSHMVNEPLDFVMFLGDYIYESGITGGARSHVGGEPSNLAEYRRRYSQVKADAQLQAAHAAFPWIMTWDDHEVVNNYAGAADTSSAQLALRTAAYQAYFENTPIRAIAPTGPNLAPDAVTQWGSLAAIRMLDLRQYRTNQPCNGVGDVAFRCAAASSASGTILGADVKTEMTTWAPFTANAFDWHVFGNSVIITPQPYNLGLRNMDQWDGYTADRDFMTTMFETHGTNNPVFITGDVHVNGVGTVPGTGSVPIASEFFGTSISSSSTAWAIAGYDNGPWVPWVDGSKRGYMLCTVTPSLWTTQYKVVNTAASSSSSISVQKTYRVAAGTPTPF